jgi:hypothetical protein
MKTTGRRGVLPVLIPLLAVLALAGCQADGVDPYVVLQNLPVSLAKWQAAADAKIAAEIQAAAYGNGVFVAGSRSDGTAAYSPDGIFWTALDATATTFGSNSFQQIRFLNGKFYAVGTGGAMASSSDGVNWTALSQAAITSRINDIAWGAGKLVIVGNAGIMAYSDNGGSTWTANDQSALFKDSGNAAANINSVVYAAGNFVAVGQAGTAAWSVDGVAWADAGPGASGTHAIFGNSGGPAGIKMAACGNGVFVIAGQGKAAVSADGVSWQARDLSSLLGTGGTSWLNCVVFADGKFVAGGANGQLVYSFDAVNWTKASQTEAIFGSGNFINGIAFGDRIVDRVFVAVGGGSNRIAYTVP